MLVTSRLQLKKDISTNRQRHTSVIHGSEQRKADPTITNISISRSYAYRRIEYKEETNRHIDRSTKRYVDRDIPQLDMVVNREKLTRLLKTSEFLGHMPIDKQNTEKPLIGQKNG